MEARPRLTAAALGLCLLWAGGVWASFGFPVYVGGNPMITGLSLSGTSFTGGAADSTTVGTVTVTTSNGTTPTMSIVNGAGGLVGSGNDSDSFQLTGGASPFTLATHTSGGATDQAGQYKICIVASGASYSNSPQQICQTIQATGAGGAGWQLAFSDEFNIPKGPSAAYMLNWQNQYSVTSYSWSSGRCAGISGSASTGCGTVVTSSVPAGITSDCASRVGACAVSITGATNSGGGGNSVVNGAFVVVGVSGSTLSLYMPYSGIGTIGLGSGTTLGSGPWVTAIVNSTTNPQTNPVMAFTNNFAEGWDAAALTVDANGLSIKTTSASFVSPDGVSHSDTSGHVQTWNGNAGFAQAPPWAMDFYGQPYTVSSGFTGVHVTYWGLGSDNSWPGTGSAGGEMDVAEFAAGNCAETQYDYQTFGAGASGFQGSTTGTFAATNHQFTGQNIAGATNFYLDQSALNSFTGWGPTDAFYPIIDVEYPGACGAGATLPITSRAQYTRFYTHVTSNACYSSIPAHGTAPHVGTC